MRVYLGIDGGGTGCRAAVAGPEGRPLGLATAGPAQAFTDFEGARANVIAAAEAALDAAGGPAALGELTAAVGIAGANLPEVAERLAAALPFARLRVVSDAAIAARGALGPDDGVTAALGTGSVFAAQRAGAVRTIGGWGFLIGDQGSGARLGRAVVERALLAHDGLAAASPLLRALVAEAGGAAGLVARWGQARPGAFAALAPRLVEAAADGDAAAEAALAAATEDVAAAIAALRPDAATPVVFLGGLGPVYAGRLADRFGPAIRPARGSALDGALAMARDLA